MDLPPNYRCSRFWFWIVLLITSIGLAEPALSASRVALIVANKQYVNEKPLANPLNDAALVGSKLKQLGFSVQTVSNGNRAEMLGAMENFGKSAKAAESAVFYYSGHGMQDDAKRNYLLPVDARIEGDTSLKAYGIMLDDVVEIFERAAPRVGLLILDACRDNPFATRTRSANKGLSRMDVAINSELLIAYATRAGQVAKDGDGKNSPFAIALAEQLENANKLPVLALFDLVADRVAQQTNNAQRPTRMGELKASTYLFATLAPITQMHNKPKPDYSVWPVTRLNDGTTVISLNFVNSIMLKSCEEGTVYNNGKCEGERKLYSLEEAYEAARRANQTAFAGYANWAVPDYMVLLGIYSELSRAIGTNNAPIIHPYGIDAAAANILFINGKEGLMTWMLPRGGVWKSASSGDIGGGINFRQDGRYPLRLYRNFQ